MFVNLSNVFLHGYIESFYTNFILNKIMLLRVCNTLTVPFEKTKRVSIVYCYTKKIVVLPERSKFPGNLLSRVSFRSASSTFYLLNSIKISLFFSNEGH